MARVVLPGTLKQYTGGVTELVLEAATIRQLFRVLGEKFPDIAPHLADGMAVAGHLDRFVHQLLRPCHLLNGEQYREIFHQAL